MNKDTELSELICTRISHDLIGTMGAISGALELIEADNNILDDITSDILHTGINTLKARQKFFRVAFGLETKQMKIEEINTICSDYLETIGNKNHPISLDLNKFNPEIGKIICIGVMIAAEIFIKGGEIKIDFDANNILINANSEYKLSETKILVYKDIINGSKNIENASQYIQLIYLQKILGSSVPLAIKNNENSFQLIIG